MATDVDVQFFSHLNGLTLGNNWGDLIRLLDKALVTGIDFTQITATSIDTQGDVHITLYAAHNAMLFQVVELSGFTPASLNQKYRIKGVPSATQLILKPKTEIVERTVATVGAAKLVSLGYEIVFRDTNDVKRVYRAKNPTAQHPFIRVDETISDGVNNYNSSYAKYAMVGLLENMTHIDDYEDSSKLQLPCDPNNLKKNWKINGSGAGVVRGWSKWYWASNVEPFSDIYESNAPTVNNRRFSLVGDKDCFYFLRNLADNFDYGKLLSGCGLFIPNYDPSIEKNWFLMSSLSSQAASSYLALHNINGGIPLSSRSLDSSGFFVPFNANTAHVLTTPIIPDLLTGFSNVASGTNIPALEIPLLTSTKKLKGTLKHVLYSGKNLGIRELTAYIGEKSMYVADSHHISLSGGQNGNCYFYLGELE